MCHYCYCTYVNEYCAKYEVVQKDMSNHKNALIFWTTLYISELLKSNSDNYCNGINYTDYCVLWLEPLSDEDHSDNYCNGINYTDYCVLWLEPLSDEDHSDNYCNGINYTDYCDLWIEPLSDEDHKISCVECGAMHLRHTTHSRSGTGYLFTTM